MKYFQIQIVLDLWEQQLFDRKQLNCIVKQYNSIHIIKDNIII